MLPLSHARIHFNSQGTPVASDFDDIYFSNDGGLAETDYVFLQQNGLPQRWPTHPRPYFHILETGFGTGANFLLCWQRFREYRQQYSGTICQRLYFSSFEKYPLTQNDLRQALTAHPQLADLCQQLLAAYPPATPGCHRLLLEQGQVVLDLWLGDVNEQLPQVPATNRVDAIFLDGFAPAKNPDMWQPALFTQLFRLSHRETSLATFTCAGIVKRGLQAAGFTIKKVKGFGKKREMLTATPANASVLEPQPVRSVTIVGGGLAALCSALALVRRGIQVSLLCADSSVAQGASHNRQGALYPNLSPLPNSSSLWHCQAFTFARQYYAFCRQQGMQFPMAYCGLLHLATNEQLQQRQQKMALAASWPPELVQFVDATDATTLAGIPLQQGGISIPLAGWIAPQAFCQALWQTLTQSPHFSAQFNCQLQQLERSEQGWLLHTSQGSWNAATLLLACGADTTALAAFAGLPVNKVRGQVSHVRSPTLAALKTVICHKGYLTPALDGLHCVGATFDRTASVAVVSEADDAENLATLQQQLQSPAWSQYLQLDSAKAAFRATVPDHLPLAGLSALPAIWLHTGLGARGLLFAPLLAEYLACCLSEEPMPLTEQQITMLHPARFAKKR